MPVFYSPYADIFLAAMCLAHLIAGISCWSLSKETKTSRPVPAWRGLGAALITLAVRDWIGILGLSTDKMEYYAVGAFLLTFACQTMVRSINSEFYDQGNYWQKACIISSRVLLAALGLACIWPVLIAANAYPPAIFFVTKICFALVAIWLAVWYRNARPQFPGPYLSVVYLIAVYGVILAVCKPPGVDVFSEPRYQFLDLVLFTVRALVAYGIATQMWNLQTTSAGMNGEFRWRPLIVLYLLVAIVGVFTVLDVRRYRSILSENLGHSVHNAAMVIQPELVREIAANPSLVNDPDFRQRLFQRAEQLSYDIGYGKIEPKIGLVVPVAETGKLFTLSGLAPGVYDGWISDQVTVARLWSLVQDGESGPDFDIPWTNQRLVAAPIRDAGQTVGAVVLAASSLQTNIDSLMYKRLMIILIPLAFLPVLLFLHSHPKAWMALHIKNLAEAARRGALANDLAGVLITKGDVVLSVNRRLCDILGREAEEMVGKKIFSLSTLVEGPGLPTAESILHSVSTSGGGMFELALRTADWRRVDLMIYARQLVGKLDETVWECLDITRLKEMESQIREARDYLQIVVDTIPVALFAKDMSGRYQLVNRAFATMMGFSSVREAIGKTAADIDATFAQEITDQDTQCMDRRGDTLLFEQNLNLKGTKRFLEVSKTLKWVGGDQKKFVIVGTIHDLTNRKKVEEGIREERHFLLQLVDSLPMLICFLDRNRIIRLVNTTFCREAGGKSPEELVGHPYDEIAPLGKVDADAELELLEQGTGSKDVVLEINKDGNTRNFILRRLAMSKPNGEVMGLLKSFWETTALVNANRAALAAGKAKAAFLANMSHELRTPMNGIVGTASLVSEHDHSTPEHRLYAATIIHSAKTLQMVLDEVMDIATTEDQGGRLAMNYNSFKLLEVAEEAVQIESCIVEAWGVDVTLDYDFSLRSRYLGDARRIRQILVQILSHCARVTTGEWVNLSLNAVSSSLPGINITIRFSNDDGLGTEQLESFFKQSAELDGDGSVDPGKIGLFDDRIGLPLAWRLIDAMHGSLQVSEPKEGEITVSVSLPIKADLTEDENIPAPDLGGRRFILVSTIDRRIQRVSKAIRFAGGEFLAVGTAEELMEAIERPDEPGFHAVFLDAFTIWPKMLGSLLHKLHEKDPSLRRIVMTSSHDIHGVVKAGEGLVDDFLVYPLCPTDLWNHCEKAAADRPGEATGDIVSTVNQTANTRPEPSTGTSNRMGGATVQDEPAACVSKVLLVEDNTVNQMVVMGILKKIGCSVELAKNGSEAVDKIQTGESFDIILMDCMMPVMDGYEATSRIRLLEDQKCGKRHTIVALTANTVAGDREKCLSAGMDDYLTKPVTLDSLRAAIHRHCLRQSGDQSSHAQDDNGTAS